MIGVIYILLWEGSIATFAASAAKLSIAAYGRALVAERLPQAAAPVVGPAVRPSSSWRRSRRSRAGSEHGRSCRVEL